MDWTPLGCVCFKGSCSEIYDEVVLHHRSQNTAYYSWPSLRE